VKDSFRTDLSGNDWWVPFLAMIAAAVATLGAFEFAMFGVDKTSSPAFILAAIAFGAAMLVGYVLIVAGFSIVLLRIAVPSISLREKRLSFDGKVGVFVRTFLFGTLLTAATFGFYGPWFVRRYVAYLAVHAEYDGERPRFLGEGSTLLKYGLVALVVPLAVALAAFFAYVRWIASGPQPYGPSYTVKILTATAIFDIAAFFLIIPYSYLFYRWLIDFAWKNARICWDTELWPSVGFIAGQLALLLVTAGIYWPLFTLQIFRYFVGKTVISEAGRESGRFSFEASLARGFFLLWGQALLTIVTFGIYVPWAYAKSLRFFVNGISVESAD